MHAIARAMLAVSLLLPLAAAAEGQMSRGLEVDSSAGGSCSADPGVPAQRAELMARLAAKLRDAQAAEGPGDMVVLNGRGYRYEGDRVPGVARDLQVLELELQRAKAAERAEAQGQARP